MSCASAIYTACATVHGLTMYNPRAPCNCECIYNIQFTCTVQCTMHVNCMLYTRCTVRCNYSTLHIQIAVFFARAVYTVPQGHRSVHLSTLHAHMAVHDTVRAHGSVCSEYCAPGAPLREVVRHATVAYPIDRRPFNTYFVLTEKRLLCLKSSRNFATSVKAMPRSRMYTERD